MRIAVLVVAVLAGFLLARWSIDRNRLSPTRKPVAEAEVTAATLRVRNAAEPLVAEHPTQKQAHGTVLATVTDRETGEPVRDAKVVLYQSGDKSGDKPAETPVPESSRAEVDRLASASTDALGQVRLDVAPVQASSLHCVVAHPGYIVTSAPVSLANPHVRFELLSGEQIVGRVLDEADGAVAGVDVEVRRASVPSLAVASSEHERRRVVRSDAMGSFVATVPPGTYLLAPVAHAHALVESKSPTLRGSDHFVIARPGDREVVVRVRTIRHAAFTLVDATTGDQTDARPLSLNVIFDDGSTYPLESKPILLPVGWRRTVREERVGDRLVRFLVIGAPPPSEAAFPSVRLLVQVPGYQMTTARLSLASQPLDSRADTVDEIPLERAFSDGTCTVRVSYVRTLDEHLERPMVPELSVQISSKFYVPWVGRELEGGVLEFRGIPSGARRIAFVDGLGVPTPVDVDLPESGTFEFSPPETPISGVGLDLVDSGGSSLSNVVIMCDSGLVRPGPAGRRAPSGRLSAFSSDVTNWRSRRKHPVLRLPPGPLTLYFRKPGYEPTSVDVDVPSSGLVVVRAVLPEVIR